MSVETRAVDAEELVNSIIFGMQEKKAQDIVLIDLRNTPAAVCDYFVICHGDSDKQVNAIAKSVEEETRKATKEKPWHIEGMENAEWVLLDYFNVVAHVFYHEAREFYNVEGLWADAKVKEIEYTA